MMEFLSFPTGANIFGHFVALTRRNPIRLENEVAAFEKDCFLSLECLQSDEAIQFIFSRTKRVRDESAESIAESLCEELGRLPLALEQAGAYIFQMPLVSLSMYLEQYKIERLRLLSREKARAADAGDSCERLAVHTTWIINMEYMKKSPNGQAAIRFMNACAFFDRNEIQEELINVGKPEMEDTVYRKCVSLPLGCYEVLKLLTDFSLFMSFKARCVSIHRLVQDVVRESLNPESKAESFLDAVRMLSHAFSHCSSPSDHVKKDERTGEPQNTPDMSDMPACSPSQFFMWSQFCIHGHHLRRQMEELLLTVDSVFLDSVWFPETAKILYECAVHLSGNHRQEEAKRTLNFAYRVLDWIPLAVYEILSKNVKTIFPLEIPLPKTFQFAIQQRCIPSFLSFESLADKNCSEGGSLGTAASGGRASGTGAHASESDFLTCKANVVDHKATGFAPEAAAVAPEAGEFPPEASDLTPKVNIVAPKAGELLPEAGDIAFLERVGLNKEISSEIAAGVALYLNKAFPSQYSQTTESLLDLQKYIFICDDEVGLRKAIFSYEAQSPITIKFLVLRSKKYILNSETVAQPWNNCVLIGARNDRSVSLESNYNICLLKCMLTNLSFCLNKRQVRCLPDSLVKVFKCKLTSYNCPLPIVAIRGDFSADQSHFQGIVDRDFTSIKGGGLSIVGGNADVDSCSFCTNGIGIEVRSGGQLIVRGSHIYNGQSGLCIGPVASKCVVIRCVVCHNSEEGVSIWSSKNVKVLGNIIYDNYNDGIYVENSGADIKENKSFDNSLWGIRSAYSGQSVNLSMNMVFRNKTGGVRVGYRSASVSPCLIELNNIYDNFGPGFVELVNDAEAHYPDDLYGLGASQSAKRQDNNTIYNNRENENVRKLNCFVPYCSDCRKKCRPKWCENCFTAAYCNEFCQKRHILKHKKVCEVFREKSSYLINSMTTSTYDGAEKIEGPKEIGPTCLPPPRDGRRFVVKVHTAIKYVWAYIVMLYDRSHEICVKFDSRVIDELLEEFGVQCQRKLIEKKLYFYCQFEDNGQLRLFTNEFPEFQSW